VTAPDPPGSCRRDRGSLTLMLAVLMVILLAFAGIVVDGGAQLDQREAAAAAAQEAARAGAGMINQSAAYASGTFAVDEAAAISAATSYLAHAGYTSYTVAPAGPRAIHVTVTISQPTTVLSLIGITTMTSTGSATASLVTGITGAP
jgi:Flp pilus assembly protein TadG